jgi:hypothetical protein
MRPGKKEKRLSHLDLRLVEVHPLAQHLKQLHNHTMESGTKVETLD